MPILLKILLSVISFPAAILVAAVGVETINGVPQPGLTNLITAALWMPFVFWLWTVPRVVQPYSWGRVWAWTGGAWLVFFILASLSAAHRFHNIDSTLERLAAGALVGGAPFATVVSAVVFVIVFSVTRRR